MRKTQGRFFWKLFIGNAALLVVVVITCVWFILRTVDDFYRRELTTHLRTHAILLKHEFGDTFKADHRNELDTLAKTLVDLQANELRITFIAEDGSVLGDSQAEAVDMESHDDRDEIRAAFANGMGDSTRYSLTVSQMMKYVAVRVGDADAPLGVVRVSMPVRSIVARTQSARTLIVRVAMVVLAAAVFLALGIARLWSGRIARVTATARNLSNGDLSARADTRGDDELALLARSLNRMRDDMASQLATIDHQRRTLEHLLVQLHEGVIVANARGQVILANPAAERLLGLAAGTLPTATPDGVARHVALPAEAARLLEPHPDDSPNTMEEREFRIEQTEGVLTLLARCSAIALPGAGSAHDEDEAAGRMLVLTDITELARTIQVKTDFVANASHELRTPLSAIRVAVETLMTIDLHDDVEAARQLLPVVDRHSHRLGAIVADLLDLSRIESPTQHFKPVNVPIREVVAGLHARFSPRLEEKKLQWQVEIAPNAEVVAANRELFVLVLDNLVDNAIKFTDEGGRIALSTQPEGTEVCLCVEDNGCGIASPEQNRVFERFYQVERARSGPRRGTGLGLAIVRHAINAMHGRLELHSQLGEGTRLEIRLPRPTHITHETAAQ